MYVSTVHVSELTIKLTLTFWLLTQLYLSFQPDDPTVAARNSGCLVDISAWMKEHHLQLNLTKNKLFVFPATPNLQIDFTIQLGPSTITPSSSVRNFGVIFDDQLTFKDHISKTAQSCRFALHNIRKIRPFLTEHAVAMLFWLDFHHVQSNLFKWFRMQQQNHVTPLFISLHWLTVAARIKFNTLMLAYSPQAQHPRTSTHSFIYTVNHLQKPEIYKWALPRGTTTEKHKITF